MSLVDDFAAFVGSVPYREARLPWTTGVAQVWDMGEGRPVVLLHGIAGGRRLFFRLAPLLAQRRRVVVPPLRGEDIAATEESPGPYLDDISALLVELDLHDVTLLGVSFGAYLALAYAARNDPRITDVVIQGGFCRYRLRLADRATLRLSHLLPDAFGSAYFKRRTLKGRESTLLRAAEPGLEVLMADWMGKTPFASLRARTRMIARHAANGPGPAGVPLTIAHGRRDAVVPIHYFEELRHMHAGATHVLWDEAGHNVMLTDPGRLAGLIAP